jgi:peptidoglycan/LPS O-acetylase OafA/YrhL
MPRPIQPGRRYVPGLDGIRALAVIAVIAYHLGLPSAKGGMLGVGVFFTLSGYLITDLLLMSWRRHGNLGLGTFWLRRARRLLPALFLMLAVVSVWVALFDASQLDQVRRQVISGAFYFANWSTIAQHGSYFARFAAPLPLDHLWSLSIEEQFYLVWPWLVVLTVRLAPSRRGLLTMTLGLAVASMVAMGLLFHPGYDPTRVYEGTDGRAFTLLIGAALAIIWPSELPQRAAVNPRLPVLLDWFAVAGIVAIVLLIATTDAFNGFLYPWGFLILSLATAAVVAAVVHPLSRVGSVLGSRPLRWVGIRSYGIYLWQWPVIVLATPVGETPGWLRGALEVAATLAIASLSWRYVEEPVRHGAIVRLWRQLRTGARRIGAQPRALALSALFAAVLVPVLGLAGALPVASASLTSTGVRKIAKIPHLAGGVASGGVAAGGAAGSRRVAATSTATATATTPTSETTAVSHRTSCRSVVYIGDSTSEGETSTNYIPNPTLRLAAQLADVGVQTTVSEISGARSIVETFEGNANAATVAQSHISQGFNGCWILALGTNEVDDVHDGGPSYQVRIQRMMGIVGKQPVMWIDSITLLPHGDPYAEDQMLVWNRTLLADCSRYPNMRVFDWASYAKRKWFIPDGIHYYSPGYVARSHDIAQGLAHAFPADGHRSPNCLVQ